MEKKNNKSNIEGMVIYLVFFFNYWSVIVGVIVGVIRG